MSDYLVSARKYRPSKFEDVVGQKHITTTLHNAITSNKVGHAYLFCGPRGVGKTTCARIFAKTVNQNENADYNIFELDAASNNGVDHIRNLIEQVKIPPQIGKYKIYIIDEVHMLSDAAFNAFLKTLEEPPKHSIFILATTEKNKLIPTIISRCQIFDFKKININDITEYLEKIANDKNIHTDSKSLKLIAQKADGSLRDSLSIFDKIYTYCNETWIYEDVSKILSSLDSLFTIKLVSNIIKNDISSCLLEIDNVVNNGYSPKEILTTLTKHFRNLIIAKNPQTRSLISEDHSIIDQLENQSNHFSEIEIIRGLNSLDETMQNYTRSINKRFSVELCIMQLCSLSNNDIKKKILINSPVENKQTDNPTKKIEISKSLDNRINTSKKSITNNSDKVLHNVNEKTINNNPNNLISISEELQPIKKEINKDTTTTFLNDWSKEDMIRIWNMFTQTLKDNKKTNAYNIFTRHTPRKINNTISVELVSLSEKAEFEDTKSDLVNYLKTNLKNNNISIEINITNKEDNNLIITKKDKFQYLYDKNNNLKLFQEKLELNTT